MGDNYQVFHASNVQETSLNISVAKTNNSQNSVEILPVERIDSNMILKRPSRENATNHSWTDGQKVALCEAVQASRAYLPESGLTYETKWTTILKGLTNHVAFKEISLSVTWQTLQTTFKKWQKLFYNEFIDPKCNNSKHSCERSDFSVVDNILHDIWRASEENGQKKANIKDKENQMTLAKDGVIGVMQSGKIRKGLQNFQNQIKINENTPKSLVKFKESVFLTETKKRSHENISSTPSSTSSSADKDHRGFNDDCGDLMLRISEESARENSTSTDMLNAVLDTNKKMDRLTEVLLMRLS